MRDVYDLPVGKVSLDDMNGNEEDLFTNRTNNWIATSDCLPTGNGSGRSDTRYDGDDYGVS